MILHKPQVEIRVYFECLEQTFHYVAPLIRKGAVLAGFKEGVVIRLIRKPRAARFAERTALTAIYSLVTPDFLITVSDGTTEIPVVVGEFSEAVETEDHELQRANGAIAAALARCFYLKVSGQKQTRREHGGRLGFTSTVIAKVLREGLNYRGFIFGKWPTATDNPFILQRNEHYLSCPPAGAIPIVEDTVPVIIKQVLQHLLQLAGGNISVLEAALPAIEEISSYKSFDRELASTMGLGELWRDWQSRRRSARFTFEGRSLLVKINRFSHAADPDRGILIFASTLMPAERVVARYEVNASVSTPEGLLKAFAAQARSEGIAPQFLRELLRNAAATVKGTSIDLTEFLRSRKDLWTANKVLFSMVVFADGLRIFSVSHALDLFWNRKAACGISTETFASSLAELVAAHHLGHPIAIEPQNNVTEDEVTYVTVHRVLKPNRFTVISVSYPGAQGDAAILPEQGTGRAQRRIYVDVIARVPTLPFGDVALEESKAGLNTQAIEQSVRRLVAFKHHGALKSALSTTMGRISGEGTVARVFAGVAFGTDPDAETTWRPSEVDFIVRIFGRTRWEAGFFGAALRPAFKLMEGDVGLPTVYGIAD